MAHTFVHAIAENGTQAGRTDRQEQIKNRFHQHTLTHAHSETEKSAHQDRHASIPLGSRSIYHQSAFGQRVIITPFGRKEPQERLD